MNNWQPIEDAPTDNARPLYLATFDSDGNMTHLDFDGLWKSEYESWEIPEVYYYWASANGIEEPTHFAFADLPIPAMKIDIPKEEYINWAYHFPLTNTVPLGSLKEGTVYKTKGGDEVTVMRVFLATAYCSDGRNRSNLACDEGIVNSSMHSRIHDLDLTDRKTV